VHRDKFLTVKPTRCTNYSSLFGNETLHVSDSSSVQHQESFTAHTSMVYFIQVCGQLASRLRLEHLVGFSVRNPYHLNKRLRPTPERLLQYDTVSYICVTTAQLEARLLGYWGFLITQTYTFGRTPLNESSAPYRGRYLNNTQQTQETTIHALSGIRTRDHSYQEAADPRLRARGYR
jgi:hypothetical protein